MVQPVHAAGDDYSDCIARCWGHGFSGLDASPVSHLVEPRYTRVAHSDDSFDVTLAAELLASEKEHLRAKLLEKGTGRFARCLEQTFLE